MKKAAVYCVLLGLLAAGPAHASSWTDPSFESMVDDAELIALVEITEGGSFLCKGKVLDVL